MTIARGGGSFDDPQQVEGENHGEDDRAWLASLQLNVISRAVKMFECRSIYAGSN
jgi:hypothetical protein